MSKRILALALLTGMLTFLLFGCGAKETDAATTEPPSVTETAAAETAATVPATVTDAQNETTKAAATTAA